VGADSASPAWKRLAASIKTLQARAASDKCLGAGLVPIFDLLSSASEAVANGDVEQGWKCLSAAQRVELLYMRSAELNAAVVIIRNEAEKLNPWRRAAVIAALAQKKDGEFFQARHVFRAAVVRDERSATRDALLMSRLFLTFPQTPAVECGVGCC
jgi:hypothetical protein